MKNIRMKGINLGFFLLSTLLTISHSASASEYEGCIVNDFEPSAQLERRLASGAYGDWNETFEESMITVYDHKQQPMEYYSISKKPNHSDPRELVVFLHGFPEFAWGWEEQLEYFGDEYHAVALDLKGHHYSAKPKSIAEYDYVKLARELKEVVKCLGYDSLILVGHDFGGVLAYTFSMLYPDMLHSMVILNAPHPYIFGREYNNPEGDQREKSKYMEYAQGDGFLDQARFFKVMFSDDALFGSGFYSGKRKLRLMGEGWSSLPAWNRMKSYYRSMPFPPSADEFKAEPSAMQKSMMTVYAPTLVLWGENDPYMSNKLLEGLEALVPELEIKRFPEHTHWITHELPDLNNYLEEFFNRDVND